MKRVTKKESSAARQLANKLISDLRSGLKDKYKFDVRLVGSVKWNTILKEPGKPWDIDYQILLTHNSKVFKEDGFKKPTKIKEDFFNFFNQKFNGKNGFKVENSTTAVTVINDNSGYSFDFVIIDGDKIIRRNNSDGSGKNIYTWNELPKYNDAYKKFKKLSPSQKQDLIENFVLPRKKKEKSKRENDPTKISSYQVFIVEVNNYVSRK